MLKFLYFGDMHGGSKKPKHRTDNYEETRKAKIKEILEIAKENQVTALLQGGDFLNKSNIAPEYLTKEILNWSAVNINDYVFDVMTGEKSIEDLITALNDVTPMIGTIGNHELIGGEIESFEKTSLNILVNSGFMSIATKEKPIIFKDEEEGFTVGISASAYTHEIDGEDKSAYIIDEKAGDYHIHIAHGMLMSKSYGKKFKHTVVQEIACETKADLTINGHDHIGYEEIEIDNKKFINPGSPIRLTADKKEINRMPKVLLITIDKENGVKLEPIYLKSAKEGKEVLSRNHIEEKEAKDAHIEEVKTLINKANMQTGFNITEIITNLGETEGIEEEIVKEVVNSIVETMNNLMTPFNPKGEYIIERLELENFQSHKNSEFEFSAGLNILAGESRSGKSAILRAIRELFECYMKNPREAIFFGENYFKVTAYLSNGYIISRIVEKKKTGKNGYEIYDPTTGQTSYYNTKGLALVQEILGLNKIKLTERNKVNVNFSVQGEGWFMLGNNMSAPDKAKLIGVIYGTHYADAVLKELNGQSKKIVSEINLYQKEIDKLQKEADSYLYLEPLNECVETAESLYEEAMELKENIEQANKILNERKCIKREIEELNQLIKSIEENEKEYTKLLNDIKVEKEAINMIKQNIEDLNKIIKDGKQARYVFNNLSNINCIKSLYEDIIISNKELIEKQEILINAKDLNLQITNISKELKEMECLNNLLVNINQANQYLDEIKKINEEKDEFKDKIDLSKKIIKEQEELLIQIKNNSNLFNKLADLDKVNILLNEIKQLSEVTEKTKDIIVEVKEIEKDIKLNKEEEAKYNKQNLIYLEEYKNELKNMGQCPVCHGNIDNAVINNLVSELSKQLSN